MHEHLGKAIFECRWVHVGTDLKPTPTMPPSNTVTINLQYCMEIIICSYSFALLF